MCRMEKQVMLLHVCDWYVIYGIVEQVIVEMSGPSQSEQWLYWKSQTVEQKNRLATIRELEKLLQSDVVRWVVVCSDSLSSLSIIVTGSEKPGNVRELNSGQGSQENVG